MDDRSPPEGDGRPRIHPMMLLNDGRVVWLQNGITPEPDPIPFPMNIRSHTVATLPCPECGERDIINVTPEMWQALRTGAGRIQDILRPYYGPDIRERFITGLCPPCWDNVMGEEE